MVNLCEKLLEHSTFQFTSKFAEPRNRDSMPVEIQLVR